MRNWGCPGKEIDGAGKTITLLNLQTGETVRGFVGHTAFIHQLVFSLDGGFFAGGVGVTCYVANFDPEAVRDTRILLWETETGDEVGQLAGHEGPVTAVAFSPDGRSLLLWRAGCGAAAVAFNQELNSTMHVLTLLQAFCLDSTSDAVQLAVGFVRDLVTWRDWDWNGR